MYREEFKKLEGVWSGTERVEGATYTGRIVFQTVFDSRFLLCDHVQTAPDKPASVAHGVFRRDGRTQALTMTWFRDPVATGMQHTDAVAEGDKLVFVETIDGRMTRTTYAVVMDKLSIHTECSTRGDEWRRVFEGTYKRR